MATTNPYGAAALSACCLFEQWARPLSQSLENSGISKSSFFTFESLFVALNLNGQAFGSIMILAHKWFLPKRHLRYRTYCKKIRIRHLTRYPRNKGSKITVVAGMPERLCKPAWRIKRMRWLSRTLPVLNLAFSVWVTTTRHISLWLSGQSRSTTVRYVMSAKDTWTRLAHSPESMISIIVAAHYLWHFTLLQTLRMLLRFREMTWQFVIKLWRIVPRPFFYMEVVVWRPGMNCLWRAC